MLIQRSGHVSAVRPKYTPEVATHIAEDNHKISVSADIVHSIGLPVLRPTPAARATLLMALDFGTGLPDKQFDRAVADFQKTAISAIKGIDPMAKSVVEGFELCFASKAAFDAIRDPKRTHLAKLDAAVTMMSELIGAAAAIVPGLRENHYIKVATVILKVGGMLYQVHTDVSANEAPSGGSAAERAFGIGREA